jgi:threonine aldolase
VIDLRSDTVTRPTDEMRRVIAAAEVGDDVFHDDPAVLALEQQVAAILGKEDAVYVASGTMSNQVALRTHTEPGDVVLAAAKTHIGSYEAGAPAALSGLTIQALPGERGTFTPDAVRNAIPRLPPSIPHTVVQPVTLVAAENTHNGAGGTVWPAHLLGAVVAAAHAEGLATHLDGARLWNAAAASGTAEAELAHGFDTVSVCFSKGLGAPMGSALAGSQQLVDRARRFKHMFGGGFRQVGLLAAAARYALDHHRERLVEDHEHAARLAAGLAETPGIDIDAASVETNIVYFEVTTTSAAEFCAALEARGCRMLPLGPTTVRAVTHLEISKADVDAALSAAGSAARD